jgi:hypothetical protein
MKKRTAFLLILILLLLILLSLFGLLEMDPALSAESNITVQKQPQTSPVVVTATKIDLSIFETLKEAKNEKIRQKIFQYFKKQGVNISHFSDLNVQQGELLVKVLNKFFAFNSSSNQQTFNELKDLFIELKKSLGIGSSTNLIQTQTPSKTTKITDNVGTVVEVADSFLNFLHDALKPISSLPLALNGAALGIL